MKRTSDNGQISDKEKYSTHKYDVWWEVRKYYAELKERIENGNRKEN